MLARITLLRLFVAAAVAVCAPSYAVTGPAQAPHAVYKVYAAAGTGDRVEGSAVAVAPGLLVTNCHVVRDARSVELRRGGASWAGEVRGGDPERDLCMIAAPDIDSRGLERGSTDALAETDAVFAIGFPAGSDEARVTRGRVESLYAFRDGRVIQTSAAFTPGASGGALVDAAGRLVGVLTFRAPGGGRFHFAVPSEWIAPVQATALPGGAVAHGRAFWERSAGELPHFLRATWFEAKRRWPELIDECQRWAAREPASEEPQKVMLRAAEQMTDTARTGAPRTSAIAAGQ